MVDAIKYNGNTVSRVYYGQECAWPEYTNLADYPVPTTTSLVLAPSASPNLKQWAIDLSYWGGDVTRSIVTGGGPFGRNYARKTVTATTHATSVGKMIIGTNVDNGSITPSQAGIPVLPSTKYYVSLYVRYSFAATQESLVWHTYDSSGAAINGATLCAESSTLVPGQWRQVIGSFTTQANAAYLAMYTRLPQGLSAVAGDTFDASCLAVSTVGFLPYRDNLSPKLRP